jgi:ribosomal protein L37E
LVIKISKEGYINIKNAINSLIENGVERTSMSKVCLAILDGTPYTPETVTEFADRCRECGKQKTAYWTDGHCSNCGCDVPAYIIDYKWQKDMDAKYCPNCGRKMVKPQAERGE